VIIHIFVGELHIPSLNSSAAFLLVSKVLTDKKEKFKLALKKQLGKYIYIYNNHTNRSAILIPKLMLCRRKIRLDIGNQFVTSGSNN
jgi:hypothetical protein